MKEIYIKKFLEILVPRLFSNFKKKFSSCDYMILESCLMFLIDSDFILSFVLFTINNRNKYMEII